MRILRYAASILRPRDFWISFAFAFVVLGLWHRALPVDLLVESLIGVFLAKALVVKPLERYFDRGPADKPRAVRDGDGQGEQENASLK